MMTELKRVLTDDGLYLDGAFFRPETDTPNPLGVDAFLLVHGTGGNFYAPGVLETFALQAVESGMPVLRINTRGHDGIARNPSTSGSSPGGATYEVISECRHDLRAWVHLLHQMGFEKIGLVGHSMGGVKSIYTLAHEPLPSVKCLVAISPPRFCHQHFMQDPKGESFREDFRRAKTLISEGKADRLMAVKQPLPFVVTAEGFISKYGPHDNYDIVRYLPQLECPVLLLAGTQSIETSPAFESLPPAMQRLCEQQTNLSFELIEGANTAYSNHLEAPFEHAFVWLKQMSSCD